MLDDARLKQGSQVFGKDYFDELLERIREIRASERQFYQKITDIYALAVDYDKSAPDGKVLNSEGAEEARQIKLNAGQINGATRRRGWNTRTRQT